MGTRFEQELDFVQCLANPHYLHCACTNPRAPSRAPATRLCSHRPAPPLSPPPPLPPSPSCAPAVLAENGFLKDEEFLEYLRYLQYWADPRYARFIRYPHCLQMLRILLESPQFRHEVGQMGFVKYVYDQQMYHWKHYLKNVYMIDGSLPAAPVTAAAEGAEEGQG